MAKKRTLRNLTLIIGSGRFGSSLANKYCEQGKSVLIVDKDSDSFDRLSDNFSGYTFVGDATDISILEKCHIEQAKEIIITTGNDNANLFVAHVARKLFDVPEIYVRLFAPESEEFLKGLKVNAIFPFELSVEEFNHLKGAQK